MLTFDELVALAESQGLRVTAFDLGGRGGYLYKGGIVVLNVRHGLPAQRVTLAHEMGHWFHGHDWTRDDRHKDRDEREADLYAARLLISIDDYARAERIAGSHLGALAQELQVTRRLVSLRRIGLRAEAATRPDLFDDYGWA